MLAALLGTGAVADAFLVAFQGVNVVRRLLTEALNASLVPAWLRVRETEVRSPPPPSRERARGHRQRRAGRWRRR